MRRSMNPTRLVGDLCNFILGASSLFSAPVVFVSGCTEECFCMGVSGATSLVVSREGSAYYL